MQIELYCPGCSFYFAGASDTSAEEILEQMIEEGPWLALREGKTFGEMVSVALCARGKICCPECREVLSIRRANRSTRELSFCS